MAFEALLATERLGDRTPGAAPAGLSHSPSIRNSTTAAVTSVSLLPARATPICPLPWARRAGRSVPPVERFLSTDGTGFVHRWNTGSLYLCLSFYILL